MQKEMEKPHGPPWLLYRPHGALVSRGPLALCPSGPLGPWPQRLLGPWPQRPLGPTAPETSFSPLALAAVWALEYPVLSNPLYLCVSVTWARNPGRVTRTELQG